MPIPSGRVPATAMVIGAAVVGVIAVAARPGKAGGDASAVFGVELPAGYRSWQVISVAHEAGSLNDIRAILGNDIAAKAFRDGTRPFPDGAIIARLTTEAKSGFEERVFVRGDKRVDYGRVAQVMAIVTGGGFKKVALVTEPDTK